MLLKIVYMLTCRVLGLSALGFRCDRAKDAELLVLRHENAVLRRYDLVDQRRGPISRQRGEHVRGYREHMCPSQPALQRQLLLETS